MSRRDHEAEEIDRRINNALRDAATRKGHHFESADVDTPAHVLMRAEDGEEDFDVWQVRLEAFHTLLGMFFARGPHPADVMVEVFKAAKQYRPELILNMTCEDLAVIFGDTRAAWSERCKRFSRTVAKAGAYGTSAGFQKSPASSRAYAAAQKGNTNRRGKKRHV